MPPPDALFDFPPITGFGGSGLPFTFGVYRIRTSWPSVSAPLLRSTIVNIALVPIFILLQLRESLGAVVIYLPSNTRKATALSVGSLVLTLTPAWSAEVAIVAARATKIGVFVIFISQNLPFPQTMPVYGYSTLKSSLRGQQFPSTNTGD